MVNRKMRPSQALSLIRRTARRHQMSIEKLDGRGKGSHQIWRLIGDEGQELARFGLTDHPQDLSWPLLRRLEQCLAPYFGDRWMEK